MDQAARGQYSAHLLGARAVEIVEQHAAAAGSGGPLFLYLAFQSVHAPLQEYATHFSYVIFPFNEQFVCFFHADSG